ncbi:MAG TPA: MerR family transcriptional regulator [Polyangiaceae bacterium LLY-WYZ-14_1]|nr:MerR family transcriptional regulator [Polyangiaceae bacterium LLY-WYZ-14_1]
MAGVLPPCAENVVPDRNDPLPILTDPPGASPSCSGEPTSSGTKNDGDAGDDLLTTGDMARVTGCTLRTIRFYEEAGLLQPVSRNGGGHRLFAERQVQRLQLILDLREAGLSLNDIKRLFELKRQCMSPEEASAKMSHILESQVEEMQRKIRTLRRLRDELASTVSVISECASCEDVAFPSRCGRCEVLDRPHLPRAARLLWKD